MSLFVSDVCPNALHQLGRDFDEAMPLRMLLGVPHELFFGFPSDDVAASGTGIDFGAVNHFAHFCLPSLLNYGKRQYNAPDQQVQAKLL